MAQSIDSAQLALTPAGVPPPGVVPNFMIPYSSGPTLIAVGSVSVALMMCLVAVRIYTKVMIVGNFSPDDYTCIVAAIGAILYFVMDVLAVTMGYYGTHIWDVTLADFASEKVLILSLFLNWSFFFFVSFAKMSFFLLYIELFRPMKWLRYSSYAGATFTVLFYAVIVIYIISTTSPALGEAWQEAGQENLELLPEAVWIACVGLVLDIHILLLPIAGVNQLQMPRKRKVGIIAVFSTGLLACIASSLAIYYRWRLQQRLSDATYIIMPALLTSLLELSVGVSASCMPAMSNMLHHLPSRDRLVSLVTFGFSSSSAPSRGKHSRSNQLSTKPPRARYSDLGNGSEGRGLHEYEMTPVKSARTYARIGSSSEVEDDGIDL